jgi:hypothetical protein
VARLSKAAAAAALRGIDDPDHLAAMAALHAGDPAPSPPAPGRDSRGRFLPRSAAPEADAPASPDEHDPELQAALAAKRLEYSTVGVRSAPAPSADAAGLRAQADAIRAGRPDLFAARAELDAAMNGGSFAEVSALRGKLSALLRDGGQEALERHDAIQARLNPRPVDKPRVLSIDERSRIETERNQARAAAATPAWMTRTLAAEAARDRAVAAHKDLLARLADPDADDSSLPTSDDLLRAATEVTRCERLIARARVLDQRADDREREEASASFRQRQESALAEALGPYHEALAVLVAAADDAAGARERVGAVAAELSHEAFLLRNRWPDTPGRGGVAYTVNPLGNDGVIDQVRSRYDKYRRTPALPEAEAV